MGDVLSVALLVVFGIAAVLLVIIILLQDEQSEGLGGIFGGGSGNQVGNRKGNILTKTTTVLAVLFLGISFALAWLNHSQSLGGLEAAAKAKAAQSQTVEWWKATPATSAAPSASPASGPEASPTGTSSPSASIAPSGSPATSPGTSPSSSTH